MYLICVCRFRRECDSQKEEVKRLRQDSAVAWRDSEEKKQDIEKLENRLKQLKQFETQLPDLQEANKSLRQEVETIQSLYESVLAEKVELEHQNSETIMALNEEREEKTQLETKLREDELRSPVSPSWATEKAILSSTSPTGRNNLNHHGSSFPFPPRSPSHTKIHSTPVKHPNLQTEIQDTVSTDVSRPEVKLLQQKLLESETAVVELEKEKASLSERIASLMKQQSDQEMEVTRTKEEFTKKLSDSTRAMESLKEEKLIKDEILDQLRNKLSTMTAERTSMEIEVDGMKNEVKRVQDTSAVEMERYRSDLHVEQEKNLELRGQVAILEEQSTHMMESLHKLESIIYNSHNELSSMTDDIHNMHKAVVSLVTDNKAGSGGARNHSAEHPRAEGNGREGAVARSEAGVEATLNDSHALEKYYTLELKDRKSTVQVHQETQSLIGISNLHEQLRSIRSPLEQFTKRMLERSLAHSTRHLPELRNGTDERSSPSVTRRNVGLGESDSVLNKWRSKLAVKTEEVNNLRAIMKARAATTEVSVSSLRSKLEGQSRAYQTELTKLKYQLRMLKKEKEEQVSQRRMYSKRCEDFSEEITRAKREMEGLRQENTEILTALKKTIQKKLDLSRELEEYKVEQERIKIIPARLGSSRI